MPDSFPSDVSLYPGSEIRLAREHDASDVTVILASPDARDRILDFYRRDALENGWQLRSEASLEGERFFGLVLHHGEIYKGASDL